VFYGRLYSYLKLWLRYIAKECYRSKENLIKGYKNINIKVTVKVYEVVYDVVSIAKSVVENGPWANFES